MAVNIVDVFPQFHYFSAVRVGCNGHVAGRVQVDTDPTGCQECCWMKSDHLFPLVSSTALRNAGKFMHVLVKCPPLLIENKLLMVNIGCGPATLLKNG